MAQTEHTETWEDPDDFGDAPAGSTGVPPHELPELVFSPRDQAMIMKAIVEEEDIEITPYMREILELYRTTVESPWN